MAEDKFQVVYDEDNGFITKRFRDGFIRFTFSDIKPSWFGRFLELYKPVFCVDYHISVTEAHKDLRGDEILQLADIWTDKIPIYQVNIRLSDFDVKEAHKIVMRDVLNMWDNYLSRNEKSRSPMIVGYNQLVAEYKRIE